MRLFQLFGLPANPPFPSPSSPRAPTTNKRRPQWNLRRKSGASPLDLARADGRRCVIDHEKTPLSTYFTAEDFWALGLRRPIENLSLGVVGLRRL